jgi:hypothetical protein
MNTRPTPETDAFFATFADVEATPIHEECYARLQDLERERDEAREERDCLLEALKGLLGCISETRGRDATQSVFKAQDAIAKATGKEMA